MTEISFVFVDGSKAEFRTMNLKSDVVDCLSGLDPEAEFFSFYEENGTATSVRFDQIRFFSIKEVAIV